MKRCLVRNSDERRTNTSTAHVLAAQFTEDWRPIGRMKSLVHRFHAENLVHGYQCLELNSREDFLLKWIS